jgi:hypothetical protein
MHSFFVPQLGSQIHDGRYDHALNLFADKLRNITVFANFSGDGFPRCGSSSTGAGRRFRDLARPGVRGTEWLDDAGYAKLAKPVGRAARNPSLGGPKLFGAHHRPDGGRSPKGGDRRGLLFAAAPGGRLTCWEG